MPPSYREGRFSASASGSCKIKQAIGASNGSVEATYLASPRLRVIGGVDLTSVANTRPLRVHVGAQFKESNQSTVQVTARQQGRNSWCFSVSTRDFMDPWTISSNVFWTPFKNQWKSMINFQSMTTHVVRLGVGFANSSADQVLTPAIQSYFPISLLQLTVDLKLSSIRRAPVCIQYNLLQGTWNTSATVRTSPQKLQ